MNNLGVLTGNVAVKATTGTLVTSDKQVILDTLNKCVFINQGSNGNYINCDTVCNTNGRTCVFGQPSTKSSGVGRLGDCDQNLLGTDLLLDCFCCSP